MLDHGEKDCGFYTGKERDDSDKPYGLWFHRDVLGPDYHKPKGWHFGLPSLEGWLMHAPIEVDDGETEANDEPAQEEYDISEEETKSETYIPDLNARQILWLIWKMIL
ncbi:PREDICTED: PRUPE_7G053200 partial [Prunus dulcis]|uniref:PREDICTED: PRUPE_7G053200 partial n=1 Tax=Prunus dulcis TaxID=3755 RepID=A0A5E4EC50_PRUDU|nr:hypothetical protein L3X38_005173 [Prunus dulcis]VVA13363.1 PREDICTED: PRUPE_7G053200 partial [Prunus dulcis]